MSDCEQLPVAQARTGDADAWNALFKRYQLPLYTYVFELLRDEQSSLDVVQEAFINASRHIGSLRQDEKFGSWLFGIAHQKCLLRWRKRRPEEIPVDQNDDDYPDEVAGPEELLIRKEQEAGFMRILEQLAPAHRSVLLLHFIEDFSLEEIAAVTETRVGTVKSRLHYAKKAFRKLLEET
ncbi:MAG TPA: sigma-70 family RNA polymerase sigma factor [Candidatus Baltobacteraceae bacterium]|nr:sigma-70 family RNA polymerase sigma factor [Candidatus Baltobacteraceae bacterium]